MHIIALVILAFVVGLIYNYAEPTLSGYIPAQYQSSMWTQALVVGGFILLAIFVASWVMSIFPEKLRT